MRFEDQAMATTSERNIRPSDARLPHGTDDATTYAGDQDAGQGDPRRPRAGPWHFENPNADAGIDEQAQLGDGEPHAGTNPGDQAKQSEIADAEQ